MIDAALLWVLVGGFLEPLWVIGLKKYNDTHNLAWGAFAVVLFHSAVEGGAGIALFPQEASDAIHAFAMVDEDERRGGA